MTPDFYRGLERESRNRYRREAKEERKAVQRSPESNHNTQKNVTLNLQLPAVERREFQTIAKKTS